MGLLSYVRQGMDSLDRHETENTRAIEALLVEKPWFAHDRSLSVIQQGLAAEHLYALLPDDLGLTKPFDRLCQASFQHRRWLALPITDRWLKPLKLRADYFRSLTPLQRDIYALETLPSGLSVVSPHVNAFAVFYGAGAGIIFQTNERKDAVFRATVAQAVEEFRRKRDGDRTSEEY
jgi:hypothetical protein